ncbi:MAG TPA: LysR family transcriptional regulator [Lachnospiraceae bacterium]|nr:LysR family transcriptional regulator [Lachnospiraceae bacterium]
MGNNLNLYYIFFTVSRCKNISGAAKELFISQPAVSKAISRLEENLSTLLFIRSSRGVTLTLEGELLYKQISSAFASIKYGEEQLKKVTSFGTGQIKIGVSSTLCKYILLPYLKKFSRENPYIKISIACQPTDQTIQDLQKGTIDIGLIGEPLSKYPISFQPIKEIQDVFVATQSYLKHFDSELMNSHSILSNATLMLLDQNNITRKYIDTYLHYNDIRNEQLIEVTTMDLLIEFAKIDLGIACVIESFVEQELKNNLLVKLPVMNHIPKRKIGFATYLNAKVSPYAQRFLEYYYDID